MLREGRKGLGDLPDQNGSIVLQPNFDRETDLTRMIEALSTKLRQLEQKSATPQPDEVDCEYTNTCYTAKHHMGQCPCEFHRTTSPRL